jgi:SIR2-like protein
MTISGLSDSPAQPHIVEAIRNGLFTPFLGAGASSLRSLETDLSSHPWDEIMRTLVSIAAGLRTERSLRFLRSFASQRLRLSKCQLDLHLPLVSEPSTAFVKDPIFTNNCLFTLQVELVRATARLTHYFGTRFSEETPSIHRLANCSVPFEAVKDGAEDTVNQLLRAASVARGLLTTDSKLRNSPFLRRYTGIERSLEVQRVHHKLLTLIVILLGSHRKAYDSELMLHREGRVVPVRREIWEGLAPDSGHLRLDAVQWMSELVWYTLRYWIPCYPTTAEMAFELSLMVDDAPPRRAELAQAAQAMENVDPESLAAEVSHLLLYCEECQKDDRDGSRSTKAFYYGVATALQHQYDLFAASRFTAAGKEIVEDPQEEFRQMDDSTVPNEPADRDETPPTPPIVFTTNFDNALENVFEENDLPFHVIYPMLRGSAERGNEQKRKQPVWWFKTFYPKSTRTRPRDRAWIDIIDKNNQQPDMNKIRGPLIVKLHGAPCIEKPEPNSVCWIVLSEVGYLQALGGQANIPTWLNEQLGTGKESRRSLWFLGYSISDWNVRLRLFEHIKESSLGMGMRSTVDREADPYRTAILKNIRVQHWVEDLTRIPDMILHMFRNDKLKKTQRVMQLTERLENLLEEKS